MKPEEAIERIKNPTGDYDYDLSEIDALVIQALEKQIPQQPQLEADGHDGDNLIYDTWICPDCKKRYEIEYENYKFCPECGKAIDRSEIE